MQQMFELYVVRFVLYSSALFSLSLIQFFFLGPNLECVGLVPAPVDGECFCRVPDNPGLQYGECMELTVEVSNASTGLKCKWFAGINDMLVEQFKSSSTFFFEVKGDQNQVSTHNYTCTHTRARACTLIHTH